MKAAFKLIITAVLALSCLMITSCEKNNKPEKEAEYVVIGGLKWATKNLGATTIAGSPSTCYGDYYAWSETETRYDGITVFASNGASFSGWNHPVHKWAYSEYDHPNYTFDQLEPSHDVAHRKLGDPWRIPRDDDFWALYVACGGDPSSHMMTFPPSGDKNTKEKGIYWCDDYDGVAGLLFSDGKSQLFFPACGYIREKQLTSPSSSHWYGMYWCSTKDNECGFSKSQTFEFASIFVYVCTERNTYCGLNIRPVADL